MFLENLKYFCIILVLKANDEAVVAPRFID